jgi:hypothetical protein
VIDEMSELCRWVGLQTGRGADLDLPIPEKKVWKRVRNGKISTGLAHTQESEGEQMSPVHKKPSRLQKQRSAHDSSNEGEPESKQLEKSASKIDSKKQNKTGAEKGETHAVEKQSGMLGGSGKAQGPGKKGEKGGVQISEPPAKKEAPKGSVFYVVYR